ncbi:MAG: N-acetyltransferase, partial [Myxococcaceae bacterium]
MAQAAKKHPPQDSPRPGAAFDVAVTPVQSPADRHAFVMFQYSIYKNDPNWVPPLMMERKDFLDPKKNPWFEFGSVELFLARR